MDNLYYGGQKGFSYKKYKCTNCGNTKKVLVNHDIEELWETCTDECMSSPSGEKGPAVLGKGSKETGFFKRKFKIEHR